MDDRRAADLCSVRRTGGSPVVQCSIGVKRLYVLKTKVASVQVSYTLTVEISAEMRQSGPRNTSNLCDTFWHRDFTVRW
jgi:hypothetical protein